jgi:hypothetical protein
MMAAPWKHGSSAVIKPISDVIGSIGVLQHLEPLWYDFDQPIRSTGTSLRQI